MRVLRNIYSIIIHSFERFDWPEFVQSHDRAQISKYNERVCIRSSVLRYFLLQSFAPTAALRFIFGGELRLSLLFLFWTLPSPDFFFCSKLESLKIIEQSWREREEEKKGERKRLLFTRVDGRSRKRKSAQKSRRRKAWRNVIWEATSALLLNRILLRSVVSFSPSCLVKTVFILQRRSNGTELEIERCHRDV